MWHWQAPNPSRFHSCYIHTCLHTTVHSSTTLSVLNHAHWLGASSSHIEGILVLERPRPANISNSTVVNHRYAGATSSIFPKGARHCDALRNETTDMATPTHAVLLPMSTPLSGFPKRHGLHSGQIHATTISDVILWTQTASLGRPQNIAV